MFSVSASVRTRIVSGDEMFSVSASVRARIVPGDEMFSVSASVRTRIVSGDEMFLSTTLVATNKLTHCTDNDRGKGGANREEGREEGWKEGIKHTISLSPSSFFLSWSFLLVLGPLSES